MSDERKWWPSELADEMMPPGRESPTAWIVGPADKGFILGGWREEEDADDGEPHGREIVQVGEVVNFMWCEDRPAIEVTVNPDGSFIAHGDVPPDATDFWEISNFESSGDSLTHFAQCWADNERLKNPERLTVAACVWSRDLPHRLTIEDGKPCFVPATETQH